MAKNKVIGIFGGTFDPIHKGHVNIIEDLLDRVPIDELLLIPNGTPPHKKKLIPAEIKLEMVQLAIGHIDKLKIDDREIRKNSPSYSYETFKELETENPTADLIWIMGTDTFSNIETWFKYEKFLDEVNILLLKRPGFEVDENSFANDLFKSKKIMKFSDFFGSTGNIFLLNINPIEITSTEIRNLIRNEKNVTKFLNPEVHAVIKEYKLYESK